MFCDSRHMKWGTWIWYPSCRSTGLKIRVGVCNHCTWRLLILIVLHWSVLIGTFTLRIWWSEPIVPSIVILTRTISLTRILILTKIVSLSISLIWRIMESEWRIRLIALIKPIVTNRCCMTILVTYLTLEICNASSPMATMATTTTVVTIKISTTRQIKLL